MRLLRTAAFGLLATLGTVSAEAGGTGGTLPSGRVMVVNSDTLWTTSRFSQDTCKISLGMRKLIIEPERVLLGDHVIAKLDKTSRQVTVTRKDGKLTVVADGKIVYDGGLK